MISSHRWKFPLETGRRLPLGSNLNQLKSIDCHMKAFSCKQLGIVLGGT